MNRIFGINLMALFFSALLAASPVYATQPTLVAETGIRVTRVELTPQIDGNLLAVVDTRTFGEFDTIHLVVSTFAPVQGSGAVLRADWRYGKGNQVQPVHSEAKSMFMSGPGVIVFQVSKPDGWPPGHYYVEVSLDGVPIRGIPYEVR
mgnify:CR=1 FL=1